MSVHDQFVTLFMMFVCGNGLGVLFDAYRVLSHRLGIPGWLLAILDVVYWLVAAPAVFRVLYRTNHGEIRFYVFFGLILGISFYFLFCSVLTVRFVVWLFKRVTQAYRLLVRLFEVLVVKPVTALYKLIVIILGFVTAVSIFLFRIMLQLFHPIRKPLLRLARWIYSKGRQPFTAIGHIFKRWFKR